MPKIYKKPSVEELKKKLRPEQYYCTQESGTEEPFKNLYWNNYVDGVYTDVVSGEVLFLSLDQFDSGSGWPSFTQPFMAGSLTEHRDHQLGMERVEVRSSQADSHLGHVFDDGPAPTGQRFCINSASLRFISLDEMRANGYGKLLFRFAAKKGWEIATLAGGCFWGLEDLLLKIPGVIETEVGYTGGQVKNATYDDVHDGTSGHAESVRVLFDPTQTSYEKILLYFFTLHDPTTLNRQGNDAGSQYRSSIFYYSVEQQRVAEEVRTRVEKSGRWVKPIVTEVVSAKEFWPAEEEHQNYLLKHPHGYTCHFIRKISFD